MQKYRDSLPSLKMTLVTLVVCLILGLLFRGFTWPSLLIGLLFAVVFLGMATVRNHDPDAWEAYHNPVQHQFRTERDELYNQLDSLTKAVEDEGAIIGTNLMGESMKARELIDKIKNRYKPKTKAK